MKKVLILLILILSLVLTGCGDGGLFRNTVEPRENSITLSLDDDYASFIDGEIPTFTFNFEGTLNVIAKNKNKFYVQFSNNEDKILSDALNKLFEQYRDRTHVELVSKKENVNQALFSTLNKYGAVLNEKYTPDDYAEYDEIAFIDLENGLKLKIEYRRFIYNGANYYTWSYRTPLSMVLTYPFMVLEDEGSMTNKLVLIALPTRVAPNIYNNSVADKKIGLSTIINGTNYIYNDDNIYYTYSYPNVSESKDEAQIIKDNQQYIIDYYVNELGATCTEEERVVDGKNVMIPVIYYSYLDNNFRIDLFEKTFKMHYVGVVAE